MVRCAAMEVAEGRAEPAVDLGSSSARCSSDERAHLAAGVFQARFGAISTAQSSHRQLVNFDDRISKFVSDISARRVKMYGLEI